MHLSIRPLPKSNHAGFMKKTQRYLSKHKITNITITQDPNNPQIVTYTLNTGLKDHAPITITEDITLRSSSLAIRTLHAAISTLTADFIYQLGKHTPVDAAFIGSTKETRLPIHIMLLDNQTTEPGKAPPLTNLDLKYRNITINLPNNSTYSRSYKPEATIQDLANELVAASKSARSVTTL